jgi:hypothetical protein
MRKAGTDPEPRDCTVYAMVARQVLMVELAACAEELRTVAVPTVRRVGQVVRSAWIQR